MWILVDIMLQLLMPRRIKDYEVVQLLRFLKNTAPEVTSIYNELSVLAELTRIVTSDISLMLIPDSVSSSHHLSHLLQQFSIHITYSPYSLGLLKNSSS